MRKIFGIVVVCLLVLASCTTNRSTINDLKSMEEEITEKSDDFDEKDWDDYMARYEELEKTMQEREYTNEEKKEIAKIQGRIAAQLTKKSLRQLKNELENLPNVLNGFLEGFTEEMSEE